MKTRHAPEGSPMRQERYASSPALEKGLNAVLVKNRCSTLGDARVIELVWFIQYQSLQQGGLDKFARDLLVAFPERVGTPPMLAIGAKPGDIYNAAQVRAVRDGDGRHGIFGRRDFPLRGETLDDDRLALLIGGDRTSDQLRQESRKDPASYPVAQFLELCRAAFLKVVPDLLTKLCLDPAFEIDQLSAVITEERGIFSSLPFFHDLAGALLEYAERWERERLAHLVKTTVGKSVLDALDYAEAERAMVLIEGLYGTGKTHVAKAWCEARPGKRRYVQCPSSNDGIDFFRTIAEPIGVSNAHSMKASQMEVTFADIKQAMHDNLMPSDSALNEALSSAAKPSNAGGKKRAGKAYAGPARAPFLSISSSVPERDSGEALVPTSDRARRSRQASLSSD